MATVLGAALPGIAAETSFRVRHVDREVLELSVGHDAIWMCMYRHIATKQLYSWKPGEEPVLVGGAQWGVGSIEAMAIDGSRLWVSSSSALYTWTVGDERAPRKVLELNGDKLGTIEVLRVAGSYLLIGAEKGLFRWRLDSEAAPQLVWEGPDPSSPLKIKSLHRSGPKLWIGTERGLYVCEGYQEAGPVAATAVCPRLRGEKIRALFDVGPFLWIGTESSEAGALQRWSKSPTDDPVTVDLGTGSVRALDGDTSSLWIGSEKGVFTIPGLGTDWTGRVVVDDISSSVEFDKNAVVNVRWTIDDYGGRSSPRLLLGNEVVEVLLEGKPLRVDVKTEMLGDGTFVSSITPRSPDEYLAATDTLVAGEEYEVRISAQDLHGKPTSVSKLFKVGATVNAFELLKWIIGLVGILHTGGFSVLAFLAVWYKKPFEILMDPVNRRFSLYYGFLVLHIPFVRNQFLRRYYKCLGSKYGKQTPYLPVPIIDPMQNSLLTDDFLKVVRENDRLLVIGDPGTGKTELIRQLLFEYVKEPTLHAAWKRYRFIPIVVAMRDVEQECVSEMVRTVMKGHGFTFPDADFFEKLLRLGNFLVILDGLNETDRDTQVLNYATESTQEVRLLLTSQTMLVVDKSWIYRLPAFDATTALSLLELRMKEQEVQLPQPVNNSIMKEAKSGYDVDLIVDLIRKGEGIPTTRLALFETTVTSALTDANAKYRSSVNLKAWELWKTGARQFSADCSVTDHVLNVLESEKLIVPRGDMHEFRHDQMRDYLAACYLVTVTASGISFLQLLSEPDVWTVSPPDQLNMFRFLADLLGSESDLMTVLEFTFQDPLKRAVLQQALMDSARDRSIVVKIGPARTRGGSAMDPQVGTSSESQSHV